MAEGKNMLSSAQKAALFDDDDDDLFVDAEEAAPVVLIAEPVAPPRRKRDDGVVEGGSSRPALDSAGVAAILAHIPTLSARTVTTESFAVIAETCDQFLSTSAIKCMSDGGVMFMLRSGIGASLQLIDKQFIDAIINLTMFEDEVKENNSPKVDIYDSAFAASITAVMVKTQYVVKGWRAEHFTANFVSSFDYQSACQPGKPVHVPDMPPGSMRFTKTIIPVVYKVTIQFNVSEVTNPAAVAQLEAMVGMRIDKVILLERTKRRIEIVDATLKCKSVLLYHNLDDGSGVLIIGATAILNTQIPAIAAKVLSSSSGLASREAAETAKLTRAYLQSVNPPK